MTLTAGDYLTASGVVTVKVPAAMNALVICLGKTNAGISTGTTGGRRRRCRLERCGVKNKVKRKGGGGLMSAASCCAF